MSIKDLEIQEEKEALKEYGSSSSGASIGDIIGAALEEDKKKSKDETKWLSRTILYKKTINN